MIHTVWRVSTIVCIWNCAHMHKAWKTCRLWPHNGKKEKKKKLSTGVHMCLNAHSHIHTFACMILEKFITARERKEGEWAMTWRTCTKWMTDIQHLPPPHTHSSAKLRCSTLQWLNFAFYRRRFAAWEMKTNMTNDTLCSSTLSSLYSAGICSSFAARDRW